MVPLMLGKPPYSPKILLILHRIPAAGADAALCTFDADSTSVEQRQPFAPSKLGVRWGSGGGGGTGVQL